MKDEIEVKRYIEIYDNLSDELVMSILLENISVEYIREVVNYDDDDIQVYGMYELENMQLKKFGISNFDKRLSFFITAAYSSQN
ncbi:hypothetical protein GVX76_09225 [[Haemophilus] felis]|nr:hypothetical protein [[Haemophilus] felis]